MRDCTRVLKLLDGFSLPTRIGVPQTPEVHIDIAAALVRGGATSAALGYENEGVHNLQRALTMIVTSRDSAFFQRRGQRNVAATLQHKVSIL
jgi:hypothetical protein